MSKKTDKQFDNDVSYKVHLSVNNMKKIEVAFFQSESGKEPVRDWLKTQSSENRKVIGEDIKTAEYGWPIGMPTVRDLSGYKDLKEIRSSLPDKTISRVFCTVHEGKLVLLHAIIKKSQKAPKRELDLAMKRKKGL